MKLSVHSKLCQYSSDISKRADNGMSRNEQLPTKKEDNPKNDVFTVCTLDYTTPKSVKVNIILGIFSFLQNENCENWSRRDRNERLNSWLLRLDMRLKTAHFERHFSAKL
jgi:hypothetical protein